MSRRHGLWLIAGIAGLMLAGTFAGTRPLSSLREQIGRPVGPSAFEEAGEKHETPTRTLSTRQSNPPSPRERKRTRRVKREHVLRTADVPLEGEATRKPAGSTPAADAEIPSPDAQGRGKQGGSFSLPEATVSPTDDQTLPAPPVTTDQPAPSLRVPPVLTPPVLLTAPSRADGTKVYGVVLEREDPGPLLRAQVLEGRVVLRILVLANGSVDRAEVARSSGQQALDRAAVTAVWSWRFDPATRDGTPIDAWVLIPVRFVPR